MMVRTLTMERTVLIVVPVVPVVLFQSYFSDTPVLFQCYPSAISVVSAISVILIPNSSKSSSG